MRKPTKFGKYLLLERIAVGGMAEVFVAKAFGVEGFQRLLAIKKILPTMGEDREFIHMFVDEARIAVQLSHANIVQVLELGKHEESLYIAMEYISGRDLRQVMDRFRKRQQPIPIPQVCLIVAEVCEALDYAHRKHDAAGRPLGIVHRDVSPQNVLVSFDGEVKLIDFGIAKAESRLQKTQAGILKGKFSYMSPEQVQGLVIDGRSDIFACGVLLWEMLSGEKLFTGDSDFAVLEKVRAGAVPPLEGNYPPELQSVVLKALAADPARRYQTATQLHDDLLRFTMTGGGVYGHRQLAEWMREQFEADWEREQQRLRTWFGAPRPEVTPVDPVRLVPDGDTLAVPDTARNGTVPDAHDLPTISDAHDLPTIKMDGDALVRAEQMMAAQARPKPGDERTSPGAEPEMTVVQSSPQQGAEQTQAFDTSSERTAARRVMRAPMSKAGRPVPPTKARRRWLLYLLGPLALVAAAAAVAVLSWPEERQRRGKLVVTRTPPVEAELTLDGKAAGTLPVVRSVVAGTHHIEVKASGFKPFRADVEVPDQGRPVEVDARLAPDAPMQVEGVVLTQPRPAAPSRPPRNQ